jgi:hypothetical protein
MAVESRDLIELENSGWENELSLWCSEVMYIPPKHDSWYTHLSYFLHHVTCPKHLNPRERREVKLKSTQYCLINFVLFRRNYDDVFLRCLEKENIERVLEELHEGPTGGHFVGESTAHKILRVGYYWPNLFRDSHTYVRKCKVCQFSTENEKRVVIPLQPVTIYRPFEKWGIYIIGEINPNSSKKHK